MSDRRLKQVVYLGILAFTMWFWYTIITQGWLIPVLAVISISVALGVFAHLIDYKEK